MKTLNAFCFVACLFPAAICNGAQPGISDTPALYSVVKSEVAARSTYIDSNGRQWPVRTPVVAQRPVAPRLSDATRSHGRAETESTASRRRLRAVTTEHRESKNYFRFATLPSEVRADSNSRTQESAEPQQPVQPRPFTLDSRLYTARVF